MPDQPPTTNHQSPFHVGIGNDIHRLVEGRRLILGGVEIPFEKGLLGHSDADSLTHAICDALLGAAALGDIGTHFSDKDPQWKDTDSLLLLRRVGEMLHEAGWYIVNIDGTIMAERPKMRPHLPAIKLQLADTLNLDISCLNLKAKTNEGLDAVGRGEAIAAQAIALIVKEVQ